MPRSNVLEEGLSFRKDEHCQSKAECVAESRALCLAGGGVGIILVDFLF